MSKQKSFIPIMLKNCSLYQTLTLKIDVSMKGHRIGIPLVYDFSPFKSIVSARGYLPYGITAVTGESG